MYASKLNLYISHKYKRTNNSTNIKANAALSFLPKYRVDLVKSEVKVIISSRLLHSHGDDANDYKIVVISNGGRELIMQAENVTEKKYWFDAIKQHINYANGHDN